MSARLLIEKEPEYSQATAQLLLDALRREALSFLSGQDESVTQAEMQTRYASYFAGYIKRGAELERLDDELCRFDLIKLGAALKPERDLQSNIRKEKNFFETKVTEYQTGGGLNWA